MYGKIRKSKRIRIDQDVVSIEIDYIGKIQTIEIIGDVCDFERINVLQGFIEHWFYCN